MGAQGKIPENSVASGNVSASGYVKFSLNGVSAGVEANGQFSAAGAGIKAKADVPIAKDGDLVNPVKAASGEITSILTGEKGSLEGEASTSKEDTTVGGTYGEGFMVGVDFGTSSEDLGALGLAVLDAFISDAKEAIQTLQFFQNPTTNNEQLSVGWG